LHIVTDSKYVFQGLTIYCRRWEAKGWIDVENASLVRDVLARLRARCAPTSLRWVKGHSDNQGNDGADALAKEAVRAKRVTVLPPPPLKFVATGAELIAVSQKLAYKSVRKAGPRFYRETTVRNLRLAKNATGDMEGGGLNDAALWCCIWKLDSDRPVRVFWWKLMHGAHRVGSYWTHITGYTERALCGFCGALESMEHILWTCGSPWRLALWAEVTELLAKRGVDTDSLEFRHILALGLLGLKKGGAEASRVDNRLARIVLSEMIYLSWILRCEWTIGREGNVTRMFTVPEVLNKWYWRLNKRLRTDVLVARRAKKKGTPLMDLVLETWRGLLSCEGDEPEDWVSLSEVLVGR
ncbi:hypothetical protein C8T65DRAFT_559338, partial [Cerioporus squamosus]